MARNRIFWPRGSSAARSLVAGLVLLMSILGCAHLAKSPPSASTTGSTSRPSETADAPKGSAAREDADNGSTQTGSAPATGAKHDQSPSAGTSSKNEADNTPVAKARSSSGGTAAGTKTPSPAKG